MIILIKPHGKDRPRFRRVKNYITTYTPKNTLDYEKEIAKQYVENGGKNFGANVPLAIHLTFFFGPNKSDSKKVKEDKANRKINFLKRPDLDNLIKSVLDALNNVAYEDDKQIVSIRADKSYADKDFIYLEIRQYEEKE